MITTIILRRIPLHFEMRNWRSKWKKAIVDRIMPVVAGFLIIPSIPHLRGLMFNWDQLGKGRRKKVGIWYGNNWQTILICSYIAIFALPLIVGFLWYNCELFTDIKSPSSLILVGFTIVIFLHFQWPLISGPRIFAVVIPATKDDGRYIPDDGKVAKKIEVSKGIFLIFIRITNLGVNTYKNSGIFIDFQRLAKAIPSSDSRYSETAWKKDFMIFKPDYIFFSPIQNYQTIAARNHIVLPIWIEAESTGEGKIMILFHCETRNGETCERLGLIIRES